MKIFKFELAITDFQRVEMPINSKILSVGNQRGRLCLWAMVSDSKHTDHVPIYIIGTCHEINDATRHEFIGTVIIDPFAWHVFK